MTTRIDVAELDTPIGELRIAAVRDRVCLTVFPEHLTRREQWLARRFGPFAWRDRKDPGGAASALRRYFRGELDALDDLDVDAGGTPFQAKVWRALREIPTGETRSYADIARAIGSPNAVRAVGTANGANPVGIIVPCHRVINAGGGLGGYGGGLPRKRWLLSHEQRVRQHA